MKLPVIDITKSYRQVLALIKSNKTQLYAIGASIGVVATGYTSAKAMLKTKIYSEENPDIGTKEKVFKTMTFWITPVVVGGVTIFCIWRGHKIHLEKEASYAAMSAYWKKKHDELEKKVTEKLSEEDAKEIKEEILKEKVEKKAEEQKVNLGRQLPEGKFWVYDELTDQFIETSGNQLIWAEYQINKDFANWMDVPYNKFLQLIGGRKSDLVKGYGWNMWCEDLVSVMEFNGMGMWIKLDVDYYFSGYKGKEIPISKDKQGTPVGVIKFNYGPEETNR